MGWATCFKMAANLVAAARVRLGQHQAGAGAGVAWVVALRPVQRGQAAQRGLGRLGWGIGGAVFGAQGVVHLNLLRQPAAH